MLLTATRIHDGRKWLPDGTVIEVANDGTIVALHSATKTTGAKHYKGVIAPGFINAHCHLELSHLKGKVPEHTGLIPFLMQVQGGRNDYSEEQKATARQAALDELVKNGVVAVGDIANTTDTLDLRAQHRIHIHSFVESIGFTPTPQRQFDYTTAVYHAFDAQQREDKVLRQSIVPHAPYSVSQELFGLIDGIDKAALLSIHNQESLAEDEYYKQKTGGVQTLLHAINIDDGFFVPSGKSSLQTYTEWIADSHPLILVHNTYTTATDIRTAEAKYPNLYWCLCPNANVYIEDTLPNIPLLQQQAKHICIGTDSLSSNHQLSVLAELQTIKKHYPDTDWEELLTWATYNGAKALQMDDIIGSIAVGKKPGLVLIDEGFNEVISVL